MRPTAARTLAAVSCVALSSVPVACMSDGDRTPPSGETVGARTTETVPEDPELPGGTLRDRTAGYSLAYPRGWKPGAAAVATEFATNAECRSVEVVDRKPPPDAGPGAQVLHSLVQVCARRLDGEESLEEFLRTTYADLFARFRRTTLGGADAFLTADDRQATIFVQTRSHRLQVVTSVVAEAGLRERRLAEVAAVLESFAVTR